MNEQTPSITIFGKPIDDQTRCIHYHSVKDIIAIKFKCCDRYYPCFACHEETAGHAPEVWLPSEYSTKAIVCGACRHEMSIREYMDCKNECPSCGAGFNPNCAKHYHLYFEIKEEDPISGSALCRT